MPPGRHPRSFGWPAGGSEQDLIGEPHHAQESTYRLLGIGFKHTMPKAGVDLYATAQTLNVEDGDTDTKDTVFVLASRVRF